MILQQANLLRFAVVIPFNAEVQVMKTAQAQQVAAPGTPAPIVPVEGLAPVQSSGIANKALIATEAQVTQFCAQVVAGKSTGKIFPAKMSEMTFSLAQRELIAGARKEHKVNSIGSKKALVSMIQAKTTNTVSHKTNKSGLRGNIGYVKNAAFNGKDGKFSQGLFDKFIEGPKPKAATT